MIYSWNNIIQESKAAIILFSILLLLSSCSRNTTAENVKPNQLELFALLHEWCDGLLEHQIQHADTLLDGGILCPACALMHGRTPDAIYPFLYVASCTGETKYVDAAKKLFIWGERNVRFPDGSWNNEVNIYTWRGITVFGLITLAESLRDFSDLLDTQTRKRWMQSIREQADFIVSYIKPGVGNINYSATACYALALVGELTGEEKYKQQATKLATLVTPYFTANDSLFYGEGVYPYIKSAKGLWPVDLGYNVEETLPNLLFYADLVGDETMKSRIQKSIRNQVEFMVPDGAWDNSWGTRNFKWSYWGSRTSDGVVTLCSILAPDDPLYATVGYRNVELLRQCTHNGLLYGGMHYRSAGYPACIHHTFEHAKGLAVALHRGFGKPGTQVTLPREEEYGSRYVQDLDSWLISVGDWRATITGYDVGYRMPGGNAHGGTLSFLWHKSAGPLLAAAMTEYTIEEPANMQLLKSNHNYSSTFQVVYEENGIKYSSASSKVSEIVRHPTESGEELTVTTELVDIYSNRPPSGQIPILIKYSFDPEQITIRISKIADKSNRKIAVYIPLISQSGEECKSVQNGFEINKPKAVVSLFGNDGLQQLNVEKDERTFCPVPGFQFIPFYMESDCDIEISIDCTIAPHTLSAHIRPPKRVL